MRDSLIKLMPWMGGKGQLMWAIQMLLPIHYKTLVDVFGGSGIITLNTAVPKGCLQIYNDLNHDLYNLLFCVKHRPKESYQDNRLYYRRRTEEEGNPAIRALLAQDRRHLDDVQTMMASSRQFCFVLRRRKTDGAINLATVEQRLRDSGFTVRRVEGAELLELLAIYFEQDATHEAFDLVDGAHWLTAEMEEENADFES